jgi:hypothetical protein
MKTKHDLPPTESSRQFTERLESVFGAFEHTFNL